MKWFLVKYIYEITCEAHKCTQQFDEQLRIISALNSSDALCKAEDLANGFHSPFENCKGELVTWKFICIADLHEIQAPGDGAEVTSILHEPEDVSFFLDQLEKRKSFLQENMKSRNSEFNCFDN